MPLITVLIVKTVENLKKDDEFEIQLMTCKSSEEINELKVEIIS